MPCRGCQPVFLDHANTIYVDLRVVKADLPGDTRPGVKIFSDRDNVYLSLFI